MKQKVLIISMTVTVVAGIISIASTYFMNRPDYSQQKHIQESNENTVEIYRPMVTTEPEIIEDEPEAVIIYYTLQSEGDVLHLYEINGESRRAIKSLPINPEMFPQEDRELLKSGIKADTLEEGIEIIENFVS